jgi:hypothetical protein
MSNPHEVWLAPLVTRDQISEILLTDSYLESSVKERAFLFATH